VNEELCKAQKEIYRDRALKKRSCKTAEDLEFFEASEDDYRERLEQIKLQKKDNQKKLKAVERCLKRDGSALDAELEYKIPVDDMVDLAEVARDEVPENSYRVQEDVSIEELSVESIIEPSTELIEGTVSDNKIAVEPDSNVTEGVTFSLDDDKVQVAGEIIKLPDNKADYMRMSVAEKVRCYPFDDKGTDVAFEMIQAYFEKIGMDTSFNAVYEEVKILIDYYEKKKAEEYIQKRAEQGIETMGLLGIDAGRFAEYSADVLSQVFGFGDMEYFTGIKLFNKVIDRLGIEMEQQRRYEVFDRIYEEGMREKKVERNGCSR
jgi:hypothetical protein